MFSFWETYNQVCDCTFDLILPFKFKSWNLCSICFSVEYSQCFQLLHSLVHISKTYKNEKLHQNDMDTVLQNNWSLNHFYNQSCASALPILTYFLSLPCKSFYEPSFCHHHAIIVTNGPHVFGSFIMTP